MPKYLVEASYTREGVDGLMREGGSSRREAVSRAVSGAGGKLESMYFAFGETDAYVIIELPDNVSAAALSLAVNQAGGATSRVRVLLTPEEIDQAVGMTTDYRAPGR